jgi:hypothetical protein
VKLRTVRTRTPELIRSRGIAELAVMVRFDQLVVALAAERVARIALADEALPVAAASPSVLIGGAVLRAWDLGLLLGFTEPPAAWLIIATSDEPNAPRIALGTGPCIAVAGHGVVSPLPPGVLRAPASAVLGVFVTDPVLRERGVGPLGVRVDPMRLIGLSALAAAHRGER